MVPLSRCKCRWIIQRRSGRVDAFRLRRPTPCHGGIQATAVGHSCMNRPIHKGSPHPSFFTHCRTESYFRTFKMYLRKLCGVTTLGTSTGEIYLIGEKATTPQHIHVGKWYFFMADHCGHPKCTPELLSALKAVQLVMTSGSFVYCALSISVHPAAKRRHSRVKSGPSPEQPRVKANGVA